MNDKDRIDFVTDDDDLYQAYLREPNGDRSLMKVTRDKKCYCHTCGKAFHYLGITRHRAMHRDRKEDCTITFTYGDTYTWKYSEL